jgi:predicted unusual protein kinase regulating ubiquinone biosynthesis (AarF/ABC1/UbiB family)
MNCPQTAFPDVEQIVKEELQISSLDEVFTEFETVPIASASLA